MSGRFLLETNIVIALFAETKSVLDHLIDAEEVFVAAIVLGELQYGAHKSERIAENIAKIDQFAQNAAVLVCDAVTARHYGAIKNQLRAKGRPIPENDIGIAAVGMQHRVTVVSRDPHFKEVADLDLQVW